MTTKTQAPRVRLIRYQIPAANGELLIGPKNTPILLTHECGKLSKIGANYSQTPSGVDRIHIFKKNILGKTSFMHFEIQPNGSINRKYTYKNEIPEHEVLDVIDLLNNAMQENDLKKLKIKPHNSQLSAQQIQDHITRQHTLIKITLAKLRSALITNASVDHLVN